MSKKLVAPGTWQVETTKTATGFRHILINTQSGFGINVADIKHSDPPQDMRDQQDRLNNRAMNEES